MIIINYHCYYIKNVNNIFTRDDLSNELSKFLPLSRCGSPYIYTYICDMRERENTCARKNTQKNRGAWYQPVALVDDRKRRELLERGLRGDALGAIAGPRLRRREGGRGAERQDAEELVEVAAQLLDLGVPAADDRLELGYSLVLGAQQLLKLPQGTHGDDRGTTTTTSWGGAADVWHLGDLRGGGGLGAGDTGGVDGDVLRRGGRVLLVGEPLLRRREAQRVEAHAHRHAGVADRHSVLGTFVHSTRRSAHERERERKNKLLAGCNKRGATSGRYYRANSRSRRAEDRRPPPPPS